MGRRFTALVGAVAIAISAAGVAGGCGDQTSADSNKAAVRSQAVEPRAAKRRTDGSHVFVIVLENREFGQVIGNGDAPYLNALARRRALALRYFAITHPSLPNYLAIIGGATFHIHSNCTACSAHGSNLALQLERANVSWRAYMEGMPGPCFAGGHAGRYVKRHNPFAYFPSISEDPGRCSHVVPGGMLADDLRRDDLAAFSWITPDLCHDGHDCVISAADRYLAALVPKLMRRLGQDGFIVLTFDEGTSNRGCCGGAHGGRIATVFAGPDVRRRARLKGEYDHYSLLRTLENAFSLPPLRKAAGATAIRAAFRRQPALR